MLTVFFGVLVWVELQIRDGVLLLLVVFSGLALASLASAAAPWAWRTALRC